MTVSSTFDTLHLDGGHGRWVQKHVADFYRAQLESKLGEKGKNSPNDNSSFSNVSHIQTAAVDPGNECRTRKRSLRCLFSKNKWKKRQKTHQVVSFPSIMDPGLKWQIQDFRWKQNVKESWKRNLKLQWVLRRIKRDKKLAIEHPALLKIPFHNTIPWKHQIEQ